MVRTKKQEKKFYLGNQNLPAANSEFEYTPEMVKEIQKCKKNLLYFAENHFYIINLDEGKIKIKLHKFQKKMLRAFRDNNRVVVLASRQIGKTTQLTIFALWQACFNDVQKILIVANKESTAIEILSRIKLAYEGIPGYLKPGVVNWGKTEVQFDNGSSISISTTTGTAARGKSCNLLLIDEIAFIEPHLIDEFWSSVYPIISSSKKSKVFMCSTPNGTGNLFHKTYTNAIKKENNWHPIRVDWWEVPGRDEQWMKETIASLGSEDVFKQEFGNQFIEVGSSDIEEIYNELKLKCVDPVMIMDDGCYKLWDEPKKDHIYCAGIDTSEGVGQDYSTIQILDITNLTDINQVAEYRNNKINPTLYVKKVHEILSHWGNPPALIERNSCGSSIVGSLNFEYNYPKIVSYNADDISKAVQKSSRSSTKLGMQSHTNTKYKAVSNYKYWIKELACVRINSIDTVEEMKDFIKYPNGSWKARDGSHDDLVMALIWGLMILEPQICEQWFHVVEWDDKKKPKLIRDTDKNKTFGNMEQNNEFFPTFVNQYIGYSQGSVLSDGSKSLREQDLGSLMADGWKML